MSLTTRVFLMGKRPGEVVEADARRLRAVAVPGPPRLCDLREDAWPLRALVSSPKKRVPGKVRHPGVHTRAWGRFLPLDAMHGNPRISVRFASQVITSVTLPFSCCRVGSGNSGDPPLRLRLIFPRGGRPRLAPLTRSWRGPDEAPLGTGPGAGRSSVGSCPVPQSPAGRLRGSLPGEAAQRWPRGRGPAPSSGGGRPGSRGLRGVSGTQAAPALAGGRRARALCPPVLQSDSPGPGICS